MSTDVVSVPASATLREAAERLLSADVGSVIVRGDDGNPVGIVTERDALRAAYRAGTALDAVDVAALTHRPVVTTEPSATVPHVASQMASEGVKKAPVLDDLELVGIVTMTDVVEHLSTLRTEVSERDDARQRWTQPD